MTQDERWIAKYNEVVEFIETNHRNPSKYNLEEHDIKSHEKKDECRRIEVREGRAVCQVACFVRAV